MFDIHRFSLHLGTTAHRLPFNRNDEVEMEFVGPVELSVVRARLRTAFSTRDHVTHILFDGSVIGRMVVRSEAQNRSIYVGIASWNGRSFDVEASSSSRLLNKLARTITDLLASEHPLKPAAEMTA
jgi:activator of HSP90 ATPase